MLAGKLENRAELDENLPLRYCHSYSTTPDEHFSINHISIDRKMVVQSRKLKFNHVHC